MQTQTKSPTEEGKRSWSKAFSKPKLRKDGVVTSPSRTGGKFQPKFRAQADEDIFAAQKTRSVVAAKKAANID